MNQWSMAEIFQNIKVRYNTYYESKLWESSIKSAYTRHNNNTIITSKRRCDIVFGVNMTLLLGREAIGKTGINTL